MFPNFAPPLIPRQFRPFGTCGPGSLKQGARPDSYLPQGDSKSFQVFPSSALIASALTIQQPTETPGQPQYEIGGQATILPQTMFPFHSPYSQGNSMPSYWNPDHGVDDPVPRGEGFRQI